MIGLITKLKVLATLNNFDSSKFHEEDNYKDFKYCKILGCSFCMFILALSITLNARAHVRQHARMYVTHACTLWPLLAVRYSVL